MLQTFQYTQRDLPHRYRLLSCRCGSTALSLDTFSDVTLLDVEKLNVAHTRNWSVL